MKFQSHKIAGALDRTSWNRFVREVKIGHRTRHKPTQAYVAALAKHHPDFEIDEETLFAKVFPREPYAPPRIRIVRTYFKSILEDFLVEMELGDEQSLHRLLLTRALKRHGLLAQAEKVLDEEQARLLSSDIGIMNLDTDLQLEKERLDLYIRSRQRNVPYGMSKVLEKLEVYSTSYRLQIICAMLNERQTSPGSSNLNEQFEKVLEEIAPNVAQLQPITAIYFHIASLLTGKEINVHFPALESLFQQTGHQLEKAEQMNLFGFLTNYLFWRDRKGDSKSLPGLFRSFKVMVEQGLIFGFGSYSVIMTRNITGVGARMGEIAWTTNFLQEARARLAAPESENAFHYGSAYLAFAESRYAEARQHLAQVEYSDPFYRLANDNLLLRISYESSDQSLFYATHAALSRHLYRKEGISPQVRKALQNLLKAMMALFELRWEDFDREAFVATKEMIGGFEDVLNRDWLRAKVAELEGAAYQGQ